MAPMSYSTFVDLPEELVLYVASYLNGDDLLKLSTTCKYFNAVLSGNAKLWINLFRLEELSRSLVHDDHQSAKQSYVNHRRLKKNWDCGKPGEVFELDGQFRFFKSARFDPDPDAIAGLAFDQDGLGSRFLTIKIWNFRVKHLKSYSWKSEVGLGIVSDLERESNLRSQFQFRDLAAVAGVLVLKSDFDSTWLGICSVSSRKASRDILMLDLSTNRLESIEIPEFRSISTFVVKRGKIFLIYSDGSLVSIFDAASGQLEAKVDLGNEVLGFIKSTSLDSPLVHFLTADSCLVAIDAVTFAQVVKIRRDGFGLVDPDVGLVPEADLSSIVHGLLVFWNEDETTASSLSFVPMSQHQQAVTRVENCPRDDFFSLQTTPTAVVLHSLDKTCILDFGLC